jgi:hypothetical protein
MKPHRDWFRSIAKWPAAAFGAAILAAGVPAPARAASATQCTALNICYCVNSDYAAAITENVARVRQLIKEAKAQGKSVGYLSIPLSGSGGGSSSVNKELSGKIAKSVTARYGEKSVWVLDPGAEAGDKMDNSKATGADYMYMWTQIFEGDGLGEGFDFFYFAGSTDFAAALGLTGQGDLDRLEGLFDERVATNPAFKKEVDEGKVTKAGFRRYYGLRASVAFSKGSHDEWNIARVINERRRGTLSYDIANQLSVLFDGKPVPPSSYDSPTAAGYVGRCL